MKDAIESTHSTLPGLKPGVCSGLILSGAKPCLERQGLAPSNVSIKNLQSLRNIGPAIAKRLYSIGFRNQEQIKKSDPEKLYERLRIKEGGKLDRCVLYVLRGAILGIPWPECKDINMKRRCSKLWKERRGKWLKRNYLK